MSLFWFHNFKYLFNKNSVQLIFSFNNMLKSSSNGEKRQVGYSVDIQWKASELCNYLSSFLTTTKFSWKEESIELFAKKKTQNPVRVNCGFLQFLPEDTISFSSLPCSFLLLSFLGVGACRLHCGGTEFLYNKINK